MQPLLDEFPKPVLEITSLCRNTKFLLTIEMLIHGGRAFDGRISMPTLSERSITHNISISVVP
jgi:hypothetical protein